ncbi:MAG: hypothetical protein BGO68_04235 [Candidatus Amoebophilus sp. 36-38]|nr:MAG: hypothetical protein BGO68_04235 [Candidatus Amoebophilus sp. 36-38]
MQIPILSLITWLPVGSACVNLLIPAHRRNLHKAIVLLTLSLQVICFVWILSQLYAAAAWQTNQPLFNSLYFVEKCSWLRFSLGNLGILSVNYFLGLDGLNVGLLGLALFVLSIGAVASWSIKKYVKAYFILYLLLNTLIIGSLVALDFLLFYIFFELTLVPIYFLIGLWGEANGPAAATKFFLYTLAGAILILVVLIGLGLSTYDPIATGIQAGILKGSVLENTAPEQIVCIQKMIQNNQIAAQDIVHTFEVPLMTNTQNFIPHTTFSITSIQSFQGYPMRLLGFFILLIGFMIKLAIAPLHNWLPDAHVQAPTPISIVLAGILLKLGAYGLLRTAYSIFPEGAIHFGFWIGVIGIISGIYAALNALAMQDLKKMIAYSSVAHMGFFLVGIGSLTAEGMQGALYQLISHGLIASLLFLVVAIIYSRTQDRTIQNYSGLASQMPYYTVISLIAFAAALGTPGFSTFIAELLILLGAFQSSVYNSVWKMGIGILGGLSIFLNTTYYVWTIQRMFGGKFSLRFPDWTILLRDIRIKEAILLIAVIITVVILGIFPNLLLSLSKDSIKLFVDQIYQIGKANLKTVYNL